MDSQSQEKPANKSGNKRKLPQGMKEKQWQPGQSGNPSGRPKKKPVTEIYEELLQNPEVREQIKQAIISRLVSSRIVGSMELKEAADRIEGKVTQTIEGDVTISLADAIAEARKRVAK